MHPVDFMAVAEKVMAQIRKGAFLTVQSGDDLNVMTIGWASLGFMWAKPMMTVMVRKSRHTFDIIEKTSEFTVSVPMVDVSKQLEFCGSESGKKVDKLKECGLEIFPGEKMRTPVINVPGIHFECKIVLKSAMNPAYLADNYKHLYPNKDYHTLYFGEIVYCYSTVDSKG
ncbi:MAG: flavin reductase family protein [Fibrobacter sp.]|nr:flavin reductase family protein [Fibrobacter sp.]